jgi:4-amino-4-deoxy-L-arabinose transferase-like glycosyltransferase
MQRSINPFHILIIIVLGSFLFFPFLGSVHLFDWDEINFAESAREMIVTGDYSKVQINFNPFWEKPPLFIWMQVLSMKIFGINEFAARFPNAVFGILTLLLIYSFAKKVFKGHVAHWWVLSYLGAITPMIYFKTGLIDPMFNFFIFLSVLEFYKALKNHHVSYNPNLNFIKAGVFTGIAILCKGPVALLIGLLVLFSMVFAKRMTWFFGFKHLLFYSFATLAICSIWFVPETIANGPYFLVEFIKYQIGLFSQNIAGHQQPFYYHALVLLVGCFPASIIALSVRRKNELYNYEENLFRTTMLCLFWVVLILFSIVKTKIVHYSSLCWLPLTFLSAYSIECVSNQVFRFKWFHTFFIALLGILIASVTIALPYIMLYRKSEFIQSIKDDFAVANLGADVNWGMIDAMPGIILLLGVILFVIFRIKESKPILPFSVLLISVMFFVISSSLLLVPKVEKYTQNAIVTFLKSKQNENCYIHNVGYKTYAIYFYAQTKPLKYMDGLNLQRESFFREKNVKNYLQLNESERNDLDGREKYWLINQAIDKPAYLVAKINNQQDMDKNENLELIFKQNGFVVYKRK